MKSPIDWEALAHSYAKRWFEKQTSSLENQPSEDKPFLLITMLSKGEHKWFFAVENLSLQSWASLARQILEYVHDDELDFTIEDGETVADQLLKMK